MVNIVRFIVLRMLLPITLLYATLARPVGLSLFYLILFLITPWLLQNQSIAQHNFLKVFTIVTFVMSALFALLHIVINCVNLFMVPAKTAMLVLRNIGFVDINGLQFDTILSWITPDFLVIGISLLLYFLVVLQKKIRFPSKESVKEVANEPMKHSELNRLLIIAFIRSFFKTSPIFSLIMLYMAAALRPSIPGGFYFMIFIVSGTYWALYRKMHCNSQYPLIAAVIVLTLQIIFYVFYQLKVVQKLIDPESVWTRLMGFEVLLNLIDQNDAGNIYIKNQDLKAGSFMSPIAYMLAYYVIIRTSIHQNRFKKIFTALRLKLGAKVKKDEDAEASPTFEYNPKTNFEAPSTLEQLFYLICDLVTLVYKNSYILLNIFMMIWSIIYHSWLTFVLLIWANVLWMIPNQRRFMMRTSVFVVFYAEFLIIIQYVYAMNLNETELPAKGFLDINLEQIGFVHLKKKQIAPFVPLTTKTFFLLIFWITSHQYFKEKAAVKTESDILIQFFGLRTSRSGHKTFENSRAPRAILFVFKSISYFVARIWMWLLIFLIFMCSMVDKEMTGFRICYMSLFLLFLMVFQMSLKLWIQFLYGYWMFVIFYAMTILTIIYTYQFDYFDNYWENHLHVKISLQKDIGLQRYQTKELFLHLLVPTLTVIFTVVQLHYFHRRFVQSVYQPIPADKADRVHHRVRYAHKSIFARGYHGIRFKIVHWFRPTKTFIWRFLEMHMIKVVIWATFMCAAREVCCFNFLLVILALMSVCVNRFFRRIIIRIATFWVCILILMKMIYQINYLEKTEHEISCNNKTVNLAEWMGLRKTEKTLGSLFHYLAPYIMYMIYTTMHAVVKLRDHLIRLSVNEQRDRRTLFPQTARQDAERNFPGLLKYLLNYGYYKFGLEITLIALVATIAIRRDVLALTYTVWLIILLCMNRKYCAKIWPLFQFYFVLSIIVQYIYLLQLQPNICKASTAGLIGEDEDYQDVVDDTIMSKTAYDFLVLLFIVRQRKAFKAEVPSMNNIINPGGDNLNIVHNIAKLGHIYFKNPTHDFCSFVRNYSDIFKTVFFLSFFWICLAVVFLGGVCSMDMLSLGYLVFALVFMIQGSEVYLQNIYYILCRWNFLIAFNVFNIFVKLGIIVLGNLFDIPDKLDYQSLFSVMKYENISQPNEINKNNLNYYYGPDSLIFTNNLAWHAIIFAFIIFQNRIFRSYYFCHIIMDTQANTVLASRGATVIQNLHYKQIYDRRECEKIVLEKVKTKMEKIRSSYNKAYKRLKERRTKMLSLSMANSNDQGTLNTRDFTDRGGSLAKKKDLRLHPHVTRAGDYYMFEDLGDDDDQVMIEEIDFLDKEEVHARKMYWASKRKSAKKDDDYSDSEIDFKTHPLIKLSTELMVLITFRLHRLSRSYRFVHKVLSAEKKTLQDISTMNRLGLVNTAAMFSFLNQSLYNKQIGSASEPENNAGEQSKSEDFHRREHSIFVQMLVAMWYAFIANTEFICYLTVFVNQVANSALISLPLPFLVLFWGTLTLPRPTKTFWVTLITYTLAMIFTKCIIHQKIVLDTKLTEDAQSTEIEMLMKPGKAVYDLIMLCVLFWHRYMLKKQGIWNTPQSESTRKKHSLRKSDSRRKLREESVAEPPTDEKFGIERDVDELLRPATNNKYDYQNIESEYYRTNMARLEAKGGLIAGIQIFVITLLHKARQSTDVYTLIFLCDFVNFFVLLFGFPMFVYRHKYGTSVFKTYIQGNRVPFSFLLMLMVQCITILLERVIYLRKAVKMKIIFHFVMVVGIHIWMFFLIPSVTSHSFVSAAPIIFYLIKCLSMLLSAYQLRCGYPKRILGNVFMKSYSMVNFILFRIYFEIPFLYILRTLLDWVCINTTFTIMEWIKMEDIFQSVFNVRCYRQMDTDFPVLRGKPKPLYVKLLIGGTGIIVLLALIWSPLFLFALYGTVGIANVPENAEISIKIDQYEALYSSKSYSGIVQFTRSDYLELLRGFEFDKYASEEIYIYDAVDVSAVKFDANSLTLWNMAPPDINRLLNDLKRNKKMDIRISFSFKSGEDKELISYESAYTLTNNKELTREILLRVLGNDDNRDKIIVPDLLPKFIAVQKGNIKTKFIKDYDGKNKRPITLEKKENEGSVWWDMHDYCEDKFYKNVLLSLPLSDCDSGVVIYILSDKSFPSMIKVLEKAGIMGLYATCVYVVFRFIRSSIANNHRRIMFTDLPYVDRILKLCNDIYLVRETKEFLLEEDLYSKLLFLYRSPETLIRNTRFKGDIGEDQFGRPSSNMLPDDDDQTQQASNQPTTPPPPPPPASPPAPPPAAPPPP